MPWCWSLFTMLSSILLREPNCMGGWGDAGGLDRVLYSYEEDDIVNTDTDLERCTVELGETWCHHDRHRVLDRYMKSIVIGDSNYVLVCSG